MNNEFILKAEAILRNADIAYIGKIDERGYPRVSTISSIKTDGINKVWFTTGLKSNKVKLFRENNKASVCYHEGSNNVTLVGDIEILTNPEIKEQLWKDWFIKHFPGGVTDPNYCVLEFTTREIIIWIDNHYEEVKV